MKKQGLALALAAVFALASQGAEAGHRHHHHHHKKVGHRVKAVSVVVPAAATAGYFAINNWHWKWNKASTRAAWIGSGGAYVGTSIGCAAVSPIVATMVTGRELTMREAHVLTGSCFIPLVGGYIVNAIWDAHPEWEAPKVRKAAR